MRVIYKAPGEVPRTMVVPNDLHTLQELVGGYIETFTIFQDVTIVCNEEGRLRGMDYNCELFGIDFVGPVLIVGVKGDEFCDLDEDYIEALMSICEEPQERGREED